jgi:DNA-binding transcriptional LysR family regulator
MRLRQIEVFHAVYVTGSITGAAQALHVSQPSVSKILQHAESQLGFPLFRRLKGKLLPTEEAHLLFREVDEVYQRVGSLKATVKNLRSGGAGHLRLAVLPSLGLGLTPNAIAKFRASNPGMTFDVQTLDHEDVLRCLYERESDLAIVFAAPKHPRLKSVQIGSGELVLLYRRGAISGVDGRVDLCRLAGSDHISIVGSGPIGVLLGSELDRLEVALNEVVSVRTFYVAAALVRQGVGVAIVDEFTARATVTPDLRYTRLAPAIAFGVHCIWLEERSPSLTCLQFIELLTTLLPDTEPGELKTPVARAP